MTPTDGRRLLRQGRRLPLPARQGQLDRGRHLRGAAQRRRRAGPRPADRAPRRQGRPLEGPAPMTTTAPANVDLLADDVESDLRASVRKVLDKHATPDRLNGLYDGTDDVSAPLWSAFVELGLPGLLVPESLGGAGASAREAAAVLEEIGRAAAPSPFLTSSRRRDDRAGRARRRDDPAVARVGRADRRAAGPADGTAARAGGVHDRGPARRRAPAARGRRAVRRAWRDGHPGLLARHDPPARRGRPRRCRADAGVRPTPRPRSTPGC